MNAQLLEELVILHDRVCSALGDPKRLMIIYLLNGHSRSVKELALLLDTPQPTVSHHLKILRERSVVTSRREGTAILYTLADARVVQALDLLRDVLRQTTQRHAELASFTALDAECLDGHEGHPSE
jgi:ArsR family transcriptional regulator